MNKNIMYYKSNIKKAEDSIAYNQKCITEEEEKIKSIDEALSAKENIKL